MKIEDSSNTERVLKTALTGNTGTGKTFSALLFAETWGKLTGNPFKIGVVDTENYSSSNLKKYFDFRVINLDPNEADVSVYKEAIDMLHNDGCTFIIVDSISPAWDGEKGVLGSLVKMNKGKAASPQQWALLKRTNKLLLSYLCKLDLPVIVTVKSKDAMKMETVNELNPTTNTITKTTITGKDYDKLIQDKEFLFGFDLVCQMQKYVYQFPNGEIVTHSTLESIAKEKKLTVDDALLIYKANKLNYYCTLDKSRYKFESDIVLFSKLFVAHVYYENKGLDFSQSIYSKHPELFSKYTYAKDLIEFLKDKYTFKKNDIELINALLN